MCLWPTDRGSIRVTKGNEPPVDRSLIPLWEAGGKASKNDSNKMRWLTGTLSKLKTYVHGATSNKGAATASSPNVPHLPSESNSVVKEEGAEPVKNRVTATASVERGRITVRTHTTTHSGSGGLVTETEVTFQSARPKGWWKAYLAFVSKEGREIRDSSLRVLPDGRVTTVTPGGRVLWEALPRDGGLSTKAGSGGCSITGGSW